MVMESLLKVPRYLDSFASVAIHKGREIMKRRHTHLEEHLE
jgi:hypothetical protein